MPGQVYKEEEKISNLESSEMVNVRETRILNTPHSEEWKTTVYMFLCFQQKLAKPTSQPHFLSLAVVYPYRI